MSIEQKPGLTPEHPYTIGDIIKEMGLPNNRRVRDKLTRKVDSTRTLTPFSDPLTDRIFLSEKDFRLIIEILKEKPVNGAKADPKSSHPHQAEKPPMSAPKKGIMLLGKKTIKVGENTSTMKAIKGAILAQQNGTPYLENEIAVLMESPFHNTNESRVNFVVSNANRILKKHDLRLAAYEAEVNGKKVRAFRIEENPTLTSSPAH